MERASVFGDSGNEFGETEQGSYHSESRQEEAPPEELHLVREAHGSGGLHPDEGVKPTEIENGKSKVGTWLFFGLSIIGLALIFDLIRKSEWGDIIRLVLIAAILILIERIMRRFMEDHPEYTQGYLLRLGKIGPVFLILLVASFSFAIIDSIRPYAMLVMVLSVVGISFSYLSMQQYRHLLKPVDTASMKLEDKIKSELFLHGVKNYNPTFKKGFNWIGGFMTPLFPFFTVVNKNWKKNMSQEAFIHEHMHIHLMVYEGWSLYIIGGMIGFPILTYFIGIRGWVATAFSMLVLSGLLTLHERVTFERTHEFAKRFGIVTREWNSKIARKYLIVYFSWFVAVTLIIDGIIFLVKYIAGRF